MSAYKERLEYKERIVSYIKETFELKYFVEFDRQYTIILCTKDNSFIYTRAISYYNLSRSFDIEMKLLSEDVQRKWVERIMK